MNTAKIYYDSGGNERTIHQMVRDEPFWAACRIQEGEAAIEENQSIKERETQIYIACKKAVSWALHSQSIDVLAEDVVPLLVKAIEAYENRDEVAAKSAKIGL